MDRNSTLSPLQTESKSKRERIEVEEDEIIDLSADVSDTESESPLHLEKPFSFPALKPDTLQEERVLSVSNSSSNISRNYKKPKLSTTATSRVYNNPWASHSALSASVVSGATLHTRRDSQAGRGSLISRLRARVMKKQEYVTDMRVSRIRQHDPSTNYDNDTEEDYRYKPIEYGTIESISYTDIRFLNYMIIWNLDGDGSRRFLVKQVKQRWDQTEYELGYLDRPSFEDEDEEAEAENGKHKNLAVRPRKAGLSLGSLVAKYSSGTSEMTTSNSPDQIEALRACVKRAEDEKNAYLQALGQWNGTVFREVDMTEFYEAVLSCSDGVHLFLHPTPNLETTQLRYISEDAYLKKYQPLILEEIKSSLSEMFDSDTAPSSWVTLECGTVSSLANSLKELICTSSSGDLLREFTKDDLVILLAQDKDEDKSKTAVKSFFGIPSVYNYQSLPFVVLIVFLIDLDGTPHILGVIKVQPKKIYRYDKFGRESTSYEVKLLSNDVPSSLTEKRIVCFRIENMSTYYREWNAVQSLQSPVLVPLAPYILTGAPVASWKQIRYRNLSLCYICVYIFHFMT